MTSDEMFNEALNRVFDWSEMDEVARYYKDLTNAWQTSVMVDLAEEKYANMTPNELRGVLHIRYGAACYQEAMVKLLIFTVAWMYEKQVSFSDIAKIPAPSDRIG